MKNITLNLSPYGPLVPAPIYNAPSPFPTKPVSTYTSLMLSVQFETEEEALIFTGFILTKLNEYKDGMKEV